MIPKYAIAARSLTHLYTLGSVNQVGRRNFNQIVAIWSAAGLGGKSKELQVWVRPTYTAYREGWRTAWKEAWAQQILTCPMLARGGSTADLPDPIRDINPLSLEDSRDCQQFLDDLEDATSLKRKSGVSGDIADRINKLVQTAKATT